MRWPVLGAVAALLLGAPGCFGAACDRYVDQPREHAQCLVLAAAEAPSVEAAQCERAGSDEELCREAWVLAHRDRPLRELVEACTTAECRFFAIDAVRPPLDEALEWCGTLSDFVTPCVSHATVRFLAASPSLTAQAEVFDRHPQWGGVFAEQVGLWVSCGGTASCAALREQSTTCEAARSRARPAACGSFRPNFPLP